MSIGKRIKAARIGQGLSQGELAEKCSVFQKDISNYENDSIVPATATLKKLAEALQISTDYLLEMNNIEVKDTSLLNLIKELDGLPLKEKEAIKTIIKSLVRDYKAIK